MILLVLYFAANAVMFMLNKPATTQDKVMTALFGFPIWAYAKIKAIMVKPTTPASTGTAGTDDTNSR